MNRIKREPVGIVLLVIGVIEALLMWLMQMNYLPWTVEDAASFMLLIGAVGAVAAWLIARYFTTPSYDPRDKDGTPLVRSQ